MKLGTKIRLFTPLALALALGCTQQAPLSSAAPVQEKPDIAMGQQALMTKLASYRYSDWSQNSVHIPGLRALKKQLQARQGYSTLSLDPKYTGTTTTQMGATGAPCLDGFGHTYWLTKDGDVWVHNRSDTSGPTKLFHLSNGAASSPGPTTDTFPNATMNIFSTDGTAANTIGYAVSAQGNFYTIDFSANTVQVVAMGGTSTFVNFMPPPFYDNAYTTANTNTVYAVTSNGTLHKFIVNFHTKAVTSNLSITLPRHTGVSGGSTKLEWFQTSPIVFAGKLSMGSVFRVIGSGGGLYGDFYGYDVGSWTASVAPTQLQYTLIGGGAFYAPPSIEIDPNNGDTTTWAFSGGAHQAFMIDYQGSGGVTASKYLDVNPTDGNSGNSSNTLSYGAYVGIENQPIVWDGINTGDPFSVYYLNTNALWKLDCSSATYGTDVGNHAGANYAQRAANFAASGTTWFSRSHLGRTGGTIDSSSLYINNPCALNVDPDNESLYAIDNYENTGAGTQVSLNRFDIHPSSASTAPTLEEYTQLGTALTNQIPTLGMSNDQDSTPVQIQFTTTANQNTMNSPGSSPSPFGALWVYERN